MLNESCGFVGEAYRSTEHPSLHVFLHQRAVGPAHAPSGAQEESAAQTGNDSSGVILWHLELCAWLMLSCACFPRQSFWSYMNLLLRPLVSEKPAAEQFSGLPLHFKDPLGFTWWLVTHLAILGQYNRNGAIQGEVRHPASYFSLKREFR